MADLIQELEQAQEGSRSLSDKTLEACGFTPKQEWNGWQWLDEKGNRFGTPSHFPSPTTDLQDALGLVPEGWEWELSWLDGVATCKMGDPTLLIDPEAATPALALTIACLKARSKS